MGLWQMQPPSPDQVESILAGARRVQAEENAARPVQRLHTYLVETAQEVASEVARGACWAFGAWLVLKIVGRR